MSVFKRVQQTPTELLEEHQMILMLSHYMHSEILQFQAANKLLYKSSQSIVPIDVKWKSCEKKHRQSFGNWIAP